jgi:hypothetical protein
MIHLPKQTSEIFSVLSKGNFISANGSLGRLYDVIHEEAHFKALKDYFGCIGFYLESGYNYYYFSQEEESNAIMEKKLEQFAHYIDIMDFFSCLDSKPVVGMRYRATQIAEECYANERLKQKLFALSRKDKMTDKVVEIADYLVAGFFFEKEDDEAYKVMDAIHYLEQIISLITINDEDGEAQNT